MIEKLKPVYDFHISNVVATQSEASQIESRAL